MLEASDVQHYQLKQLSFSELNAIESTGSTEFVEDYF